MRRPYSCLYKIMLMPAPVALLKPLREQHPFTSMDVLPFTQQGELRQSATRALILVFSPSVSRVNKHVYRVESKRVSSLILLPTNPLLPNTSLKCRVTIYCPSLLLRPLFHQLSTTCMCLCVVLLYILTFVFSIFLMLLLTRIVYHSLVIVSSTVAAEDVLPYMCRPSWYLY